MKQYETVAASQYLAWKVAESSSKETEKKLATRKVLLCVVLLLGRPYGGGYICSFLRTHHISLFSIADTMDWWF
jgi:hypothetical protein